MPSALKKGKQGKSSSASSKASPLVSSAAPMSGTIRLSDAMESLVSGKAKVPDDSSSVGIPSEFDSVSNNGSCSGESEDQTQAPAKERAFIPGLEPSSDKQEKIRMKNERKHQRQRERKVQALKDTCAIHLIARKFDSLAQDLVTMGFPYDNARIALFLNDGDLEKSVAFLLEDGMIPQNFNCSLSNLKLDISQELSRLSDIETQYGYPLAQIVRGVAACEGDIDAAINWLRADEHARRIQQHQRQQQLQAQPQSLKIPETKLLSSDPRLWQVPPPGSVTPAAAGMHTAPPNPPVPVWPRPVSGNLSVTPVPAGGGGGARLDPASLKVYEQRQQEVLAEWRNTHPSHQQAMLQRFHPNLITEQQQQQQQQQHQMGIPAHLYHQLHLTVPAPRVQAHHPQWNTGNLKAGSDSWNVPAAASSFDYQAIDWSTGIPPSPFVKPATSFGLSMLPRSVVKNEGWNGSGYRGFPEASDFASQEWTSPFAGKDLVHHQAVPSL